MMYIFYLLIVIIVISIVLVYCIFNKNNFKKNDIIFNTQNYSCSLIQKNGQEIGAKIDISYDIIDLKRIKENIRNRRLEFELITKLKWIVATADNIEDKKCVENNLKNEIFKIENDLGMHVTELHISFMNKNDLHINKNSSSITAANIIDNTSNKENDNYYNFTVSVKTIFGKFFSEETKFNTKIININNYRLSYNLSRNYDNLGSHFKNGERKYNSFTEGIKDIYVEDIISIKYRTGFTFAICFFDFMASILALFGFLVPIISQIYFWIIIITGFQKTPIDYFNYISIYSYILYVVSTILFMFYFITKCIEIKYKTEEGVRKIRFPISRIFFLPIPYNIKNQLNKLLGDIKKSNPNVKIKKDKLKWIIISYMLIITTMYTSLFVFMRQKYLQDNDFSYNKKNYLIYSDITFDKGKLLGMLKQDNNYSNSIPQNVYELSNGEKIVVNEYSDDKKYGKLYNVCIKKYYKKDSKQLFKTDYIVEEDNNVINVLVDNIRYVYEYSSNKMFKLNPLNDDNIIDYGTKIYYREKENVDTLYNFINYGENMLVITNDFDVKEFKTNHYETLEKIDKYISENGMCYILKANYNKKADYLMYIENKSKSHLNELDGILLSSYINRNGAFKDDSTAKNSFRKICPQK